MIDRAEIADVMLWGRQVGAVAWDESRGLASFQYHAGFLRSGVELSPLMMPLVDRVYSFGELSRETYQGLPGLLADCLPDKFGNLLINQWLAQQGRSAESFSPIERLCYIGNRGMGALEFKPTIKIRQERSVPLQIKELVNLANQALSQKKNHDVKLGGGDEVDAEALRDIILVGTSAGGARAKAVVAWNEKTGAVRSGQVKAPEGFTYWLMKFDGVTGNNDKELADPLGFGKIEYAYYKMVLEAGIEMSESRLFHENGRSHFMTKRFDRTDVGQKIFMQSLCGIAHFDFNRAGAYSYEQAMLVIQKLGLPKEQLIKLYRRAVFNIIARNQDDHTKNIAFLMNKRGQWELAPAFDMTYSYNPTGAWTGTHQMTFNGKRDNFTKDDFTTVAKRFNIPGNEAKKIVFDVKEGILKWPKFAAEAGVEDNWIRLIASNHRI